MRGSVPPLPRDGQRALWALANEPLIRNFGRYIRVSQTAIVSPEVFSECTIEALCRRGLAYRLSGSAERRATIKLTTRGRLHPSLALAADAVARPKALS